MNASPGGSPFSGYFTRLLVGAADAGASDLHLEPTPHGAVVRIRVNGVLRTIAEVEEPLHARRLMEVARVRAGFDMGLAGAPQDARFSTDHPEVDWRASLVPVLHGEKVVLRLLPRHQQWSLSSYPMRSDARRDLRRALGAAEGLVVVSGPTGSGKSSLLYSALGSLDRGQLNVVSVEDPVEYTLSGVSQSQVDRRAGASFADLLRALLRSDPDVILVGEVRDAETAEIALHAAMTGHLVLTTVHARSVAEVGQRLEGLGVDPALVEATAVFSSAQRLVPRLCPECRIPDPEGAAHLSRAFPTLQRELEPLRSTGCDACGHTGIAGRVLLLEWRYRSGDRLVRKGSLRASALVHLSRGEIDAHHACAR